MKKFKFQLEGLLTLRDWDEQKAKQELGRITGRIADLKRELDAIGDAKDALFTQWNEGSTTRFNPRDRILMSGQVAQFGDQSVEIRQRIEKAEQHRVEAIGKLKEAARSKRVVKDLRGRRLEEFRAEYHRQEAREIEDIFNSRHRGGDS